MMNKEELKRADHLIDLALEEDIAGGDLTTESLIPAESQKEAVLIAKEDGVIAGLEIAERVFRRFDDNLQWKANVNDGDPVTKGDLIVSFRGSYQALLTAERTALNFLQRLSGIATAARQYSQAICTTKTQILDTRKTLPGYRLLDKYAVRTGGAHNHRIGLFDLVLIKDNHIDICGGISQAVDQARKYVPESIHIEVETTTMEQVREALKAKADIIMLDNMTANMMKQAVVLIDGRAKVEASGNITLSRLPEIAATGVDYISVGALTHSVRALDISQRIKE